MSVADPEEGPGGVRPPLFLDQTEARRAEKNLLDTAPPFSLGLDDQPPPPLSEGLDPLLYVHTDTGWIAFRADMNDDVNSCGTELQRV